MLKYPNVNLSPNIAKGIFDLKIAMSQPKCSLTYTVVVAVAVDIVTAAVVVIDGGGVDVGRRHFVGSLSLRYSFFFSCKIIRNPFRSYTTD